MKQLDEKQKKLVVDNINLVYYILDNYFYNNFKFVEREELAQEGMVALCRAALYFKEDKGVKFSTYAGRCLKKHFVRVLQTNYKGNFQNNANIEEIFDKGECDNYTYFEEDDFIQFLKKFLKEREVNFLVDFYYNNMSLESLTKKYGYKNKTITSSIRTRIILKLSNNPKFTIDYKKYFT